MNIYFHRFMIVWFPSRASAGLPRRSRVRRHYSRSRDRALSKTLKWDNSSSMGLTMSLRTITIK